MDPHQRKSLGRHCNAIPSSAPSSASPNRHQLVNLYGRPLIRPNSALARLVVMGNDLSTGDQQLTDNREPSWSQNEQTRNDLNQKQHAASNLTLLLNQREQQQPLNDAANDRRYSNVDEADSASGPLSSTPRFGTSAPLPASAPAYSDVQLSRQYSTGDVATSAGAALPTSIHPVRVRR
jgi:hypothetical protein